MSDIVERLESHKLAAIGRVLLACREAAAEVMRLRMELAEARNKALDEAADIAERIASRRRKFEASHGFGPDTATVSANAYWCEEIAAAIRELKANPNGGT